MKKTWVRLSLILILTGGFLYFFFRSVEWGQVFRYLTDVDVGFFILLILLAPLHLVTRALRWEYLLRQEKKGIRFYSKFAGNAVGFTVNFVFPGRIGELVRPLYIAQKENMKKGFVVGTIVVERIFDIFTMCFFLGFFLLMEPVFRSAFSVDKAVFSNLYWWGIIGVAFASLLMVVVLSLYFFRDKTLSLIQFILKPLPQKFSEKINNLFQEFVLGLKFFHSFRNLLIYIGLSFVVWLGIIFFYWILFFAYHISVPLYSVFPYVFLTMVGASIPTPGMVGGFHYFSKLGLTTLFQVNLNLAVSMTIVVHAVQVVMTCLMGYGILCKEGISLLQIKKLSEGTSK
ncbi:flippase-like domain-containing protein [bacterium]|nr:flippase-like domain-containing protein [bacterium]